MFINRLKKSLKKIAEPLLWLIVTVALIFLLEKFEALRNIVLWSFMPILVLILLTAMVITMWAWIDWQFIEPYKNYKASKNK